MKFRDAIPGLLILFLRLCFVPPTRWAADWISVLAIFWMALELTREKPRLRNASLGLAGLWITLIYAFHQGPWTLAGWN